jgi:hypothetical protein
MTQDIFLVSSLITALTIIITFLIKIYKFFSKLEKKYEEMNITLSQNNMYILKLTVMNNDMPLLERIKGGEQYMAKGGNGLIKQKYDELLEEYEKRERENKI